jgi:hypothetical protein
MAKLSYATRKKMPKSSFALPSKKEGGKGGYPIPDASHARNALARVAQHGSSSEKATVRAKVHRKFPTIGKMHEGGTIPESGAYEMKKGEVVIPVGKPSDDYHFVSHTKNLDMAHVMETQAPATHISADGVGHWESDGDDVKFVKG